MADDLNDIVSTNANSHTDPASASTQHLLQAITAAAMDVLDTQPTDAGSARQSRKAIFPSISPSLFKRAVTADTNTASATDPKMDANPLTTSAPSGTSSSQDNTHASPLNSSGKRVRRSIPRSTRTGRRRRENQARAVAQHRSLHEDTFHEEETDDLDDSSLPRIVYGRRMATRNRFWENLDWDVEVWEVDEDEGYNSI